jgi:hypothetical protein
MRASPHNASLQALEQLQCQVEQLQLLVCPVHERLVCLSKGKCALGLVLGGEGGVLDDVVV